MYVIYAIFEFGRTLENIYRGARKTAMICVRMLYVSTLYTHSYTIAIYCFLIKYKARKNLCMAVCQDVWQVALGLLW